MSTETATVSPAVHPKHTTTKSLLGSPYLIVELFEKDTGKRFCAQCRAMLPVGDFPYSRQQGIHFFSCKLHPTDPPNAKPGPTKKRTNRPEVRGGAAEVSGEATEVRGLAAKSLRNRAWQDLPTFGQGTLPLTLAQTKDLLLQEHIDDYAHFAIIPRRPHEPLTQDNAIVVSVPHRRYLTGLWRQRHDPLAYERDLQTLLDHGRDPH
jgi:hypothetical protein